MKGLDCQFAVVMSVWGVKTGKAQREHMFSAVLPTTDTPKLDRLVRKVPQPEIVVVCSLRRLR
jgi:hypothetical protein